MTSESSPWSNFRISAASSHSLGSTTIWARSNPSANACSTRRPIPPVAGWRFTPEAPRVDGIVTRRPGLALGVTGDALPHDRAAIQWGYFDSKEPAEKRMLFGTDGDVGRFGDVQRFDYGPEPIVAAYGEIASALKTMPNSIIEQFIDGRELYVGVLGNERLQILPVWEMSFAHMPDNKWKIATERVKWSTQYQKKHGIMTDAAAHFDRARAPVWTWPELKRAPVAFRTFIELTARNWAHGVLEVITPDGLSIPIRGDEGPTARLVVKDYRFVGRLMSGGSIGFAEGYIAGE